MLWSLGLGSRGCGSEQPATALRSLARSRLQCTRKVLRPEQSSSSSQLVSSMKWNNGGQQIVAQPVTGKEGDLKQLSHPSIRQQLRCA
jgi:hypothetical protein